ncbi:MAG: TolC family protein [Polyangiaceae bacterium]|nr:TolC family protein [Polyangiaceae bacterium]
MQNTSPSRSSRPPALARATVFALLLASPASALQPLDTFLAAAHTKNPDARSAEANEVQKAAEVGQARARLLPSFTARGVYTHNQFEISTTFPGAGEIIISPKNQFDATLLLDVPLIDLGQWARYAGQKAQAELATASKVQGLRSLDERVVRSYALLVAAHTLGAVAARSLALAEQNRTLVRERKAAGSASDLDVMRADANVERAKQEVADASLSYSLGQRTLETLSGVSPTRPEGTLEDPMNEEAPLDEWLGRVTEAHPDLQASRSEREVADAARRAARLGWLPTLSAQAQERLTNATGFAGKVGQYAIGANITFRLDFGLSSNVDVANAIAKGSEARSEGARRRVEDAIFESWHRVHAGLAKGRAARAQALAANRAADLAQDRYAVGSATEFDVTQAQRDAFLANVSRLQADLDLTQSRILLRLAANQSFAEQAKVTAGSIHESGAKSASEKETR